MAVHTHHLEIAGSTLTKRFTSWNRGEHRREWELLRHVHAYAPDLVPAPIAADLDADPPWVTMTVVPGAPLEGDLSAAQVGALADAIGALWSVPRNGIDAVAPWRSCLPFARRLTDGVRPDGGIELRAFDAAVGWWTGPDPALLGTPPTALIIGHGDANLANYLWDGHRVRIVDFEDAGLSDSATELAILVEHLSTRRIDASGFISRFDVDPVRLRAARRAWAMFWLRLLLPGGPSAHRNAPDVVAEQADRLLRLLNDDHALMDIDACGRT